MNGGYMMIDCKQLDLTNLETSQTISGLYAECEKAFKHDKPIYAYNCKYGNSVGHVSPVPVFATHSDVNTICLTSSVLQIFVTSADAVTINSMIIS